MSEFPLNAMFKISLKKNPATLNIATHCTLKYNCYGIRVCFSDKRAFNDM